MDETVVKLTALYRHELWRLVAGILVLSMAACSHTVSDDTVRPYPSSDPWAAGQVLLSERNAAGFQASFVHLGSSVYALGSDQNGETVLAIPFGPVGTTGAPGTECSTRIDVLLSNDRILGVECSFGGSDHRGMAIALVLPSADRPRLALAVTCGDTSLVWDNASESVVLRIISARSGSGDIPGRSDSAHLILFDHRLLGNGPGDVKLMDDMCESAPIFS